MTANLVTILPARRMVLDREPVRGADRWVSGWRMSDDPMERIGGERSVWYWLRAECRRTARDATALARLWWALRDGVPALTDPYEDIYAMIPAGRHHDVRAHEWVFRALSVATWCTRCRTAPSWTMTGDDRCAWCGAAGWGR